MARREIIVSAHPDEAGVAPEYQPLLNRFADTLTPLEKAFYERDAMLSGDLWFAYYDRDEGRLATDTGPCHEIAITGLKGYSDEQALAFLPALLKALDTAVNG